MEIMTTSQGAREENQHRYLDHSLRKPPLRELTRKLRERRLTKFAPGFVRKISRKCHENMKIWGTCCLIRRLEHVMPHARALPLRASDTALGLVRHKGNWK